jgi:CubicO group peptidase (beta-lactamase class C family)
MTRLKLFAIVCAAALAAAVGAAAPTTAHPGQPSAVFDPNEVDWYSYHDKSITDFDAIIAGWWDTGFIPVDLEVDTFDGGELSFGGAAQRNLDGRIWMVDTVMTTAEYATTNADAIKRHMRLADREMYAYKGTMYVGALWVGNPENLGWYTSKFTATLAELNTFVAQQEHAGRLPIDFDIVATSSGVGYSVVMLDNPEGLDWHLRADLTYAQFLSVDSTYGGSGFRTISMDSAKKVFGGIWWENANGRTWASRILPTDKDYDISWHSLADLGLRQIFNGRYVGADNKVHNMATWRQNGDRYNWDLKYAVDSIVQTEMAAMDLPGVSVAVMENGVYRYKRGWGYADIADGIPMDSEHVLRTASVSKAIGGALLLKLADHPELWDLTVNDPVTMWIDGLADDYGPVTLEMLASNRACVRHYASAETYSDPAVKEAQAAADDEMSDHWYESAGDAFPLYGSDALVCAPGTPHYSTYGYAVLDYAMQTATTQSSAQLLRNELTEPLGLSTLVVEDLDDPSIRAAKAYAGEENDEIDLHGKQKSFSPSGGGYWSNAADLTMFAHDLVTGEIVGSPDYIWTGTPWTDYAYGWNLLSQNGHVKLTKKGGADGSDAYLIAYPDDDIEIAVLINREELTDGDSSAVDIAEAIGAMLV